MAPKRKHSNGSSYTECPACQVKVAACLMNAHLDLDCKVLNQCNSTKTGKFTSSPSSSSSHHHNRTYVDAKEIGYDNDDNDDSVVNGGILCKDLSKNVLDPPSIKNTSRDEETVVHGAESSNSTVKRWKNFKWSFITTCPESVRTAPKGHHIMENFISEEEERGIMSFLDTDLRNPWRMSAFNGLHLTKCYGIRMDLRKRCVQPEVFKIPEIVLRTLERLRRDVPVLKNFEPNETNAISYSKHEGHWLKPHVDDRQLSGTIIVNFSLCGDCKMTYIREKMPSESFQVLLRRRSIQIQTGECRYSFTHSIANEDLLSPRRVSMTFRQSLLP